MLVWIILGGVLGSALTVLLADGRRPSAGRAGGGGGLVCGHRAAVGDAFTLDSGRTWLCRACWRRRPS